VEGRRPLGAGRVVLELLRLRDVVCRDPPVRLGLAGRIRGRGPACARLFPVARHLAGEARPVLLALAPPRLEARAQRQEREAGQHDRGDHDQNHCQGGHEEPIPASAPLQAGRGLSRSRAAPS
jgi:hypothetical protein